MPATSPVSISCTRLTRQLRNKGATEPRTSWCPVPAPSAEFLRNSASPAARQTPRPLSPAVPSQPLVRHLRPLSHHATAAPLQLCPGAAAKPTPAGFCSQTSRQVCAPPVSHRSRESSHCPAVGPLSHPTTHRLAVRCHPRPQHQRPARDNVSSAPPPNTSLVQDTGLGHSLVERARARYRIHQPASCRQSKPFLVAQCPLLLPGGPRTALLDELILRRRALPPRQPRPLFRFLPHVM